MIISHKHRFIFLHSPKSAGSSVQVSLYRYLGQRDIALGSWQEALSLGIRPNARMLAWASKPPGLKTLAHAVGRPRDRRNTVNEAIKRTAASTWSLPAHQVAHINAIQLRDRFPAEWTTYYRFCIVRNPYDRVVSDYFWRTQRIRPRPSFREYLDALNSGRYPEGYLDLPLYPLSFYSIRGRVAVNRICFYERLREDLAEAIQEAGVRWDGWLPLVKSSNRAGSYREMYGSTEVAMVEKLFRSELEAFGYTF